MGTAARRWFDDAREVDLPSVVAELGFELRGGRAGPCPSCGAERISRDDRRPPLLVSRSRDRGWKCFACNAGGDALALVASVVVGTAKPSGSEWGTVREWYAARGWAPPDGPMTGEPAVRIAPRPRVALPPPPEEELFRLDPEEVRTFWEGALPVFTEGRALRWLRARADNPGKGWGGSAAWFGDPAALVALMGVARALPPGHPCPPWAAYGRSSWADGGWSLLLPCYGPDGSLVALKARWTGTKPGDQTGYLSDAPVDPDDPSTYLDHEPPGGWSGPPWLEVPPSKKELNPKGSGATRGTVYACPVGRVLLEEGAASFPRGIWDGRILVVEGGASFLRYACDPARFERNTEGHLRPVFPRPAFFGVWSGAWPDGPEGDALAARLVGAERVTVTTDDDKNGDDYAAAILSTCNRAGIRAVRVKW